MKRILSVCAFALLAMPSVSEARSGLATKYRPADLLGGYKEKEVKPGTWRVHARSNGVAEIGFARNMAIYRAADILREHGFPYMQVVDQKGISMHIGLSEKHAGETMTLWVRGSNGPEAPADCTAKTQDLCFTVPVARTIERVRPFLTFPDD